MPAIDGKKVPIELSLAVHSDAGYNKDGKSTWGALAICTTNFNDERLNSGISRFTSKDFAKTLLKNLVTDIKAKYGEFGERYLWDRNYSETRLPEVPSAIIETLSHQSFPDMKLAQNPMGKFTIARSLYKSILRYVSSNHGRKYTVQPLPPNHFSVEVNALGVATLSWSPQTDKQEPSAIPSSYLLYIAEGRGGFDNGQMVKTAACQVKLEPGKLYRFKVTAFNKGLVQPQCQEDGARGQQLPPPRFTTSHRQRHRAGLRPRCRPRCQLWLDGRMERQAESLQ